MSLMESLATQPVIDTHILSYMGLRLIPIFFFYHVPGNEWVKLI